MNVTGVDGKAYQFPDDATDQEITSFFEPAPAHPKAPGVWDTVKQAATGAAKNTVGIAENVANQVTQLGAMTLTAIPNIVGSTGAELADAVVNERMPTFKGIGDRFQQNLEPQIYQPQTESGKQQVEATGKVMTAIPAAVDAIDAATGDTFKRNYPNTYAATQVAGEFAPWIVGGKAIHGGGKPSVIPREVKDISKAELKNNTVPDAPPADVFEQAADQARTEAPRQEAPQPEPPPAEPVTPPNYTSKQEPASPERITYEIGLTQDPTTSKAAMMMPDLGADGGKFTLQTAKESGLVPLKENGSYYLFNPKQTTAVELRKAVKNGTEGNLLGYGTDSVPEKGIDYAVSTDGRGTVDLPTIKEWRDNNQLGFAGRAVSQEMAAAKMQEMGAKPAELPIIEPYAPQAPVEALQQERIQAPAQEQVMQADTLNIQPEAPATAPTFERLAPAGRRGAAVAYNVKLSPSQHSTIREIRQEVSDGMAGDRVGIYNTNEPGFTNVAWGSSFPEYFQDKGLTKKEVLPVLDRIIKGEAVTEKQWLMAEDLLKAKRTDILNQTLTERTRRFEERVSQLEAGEPAKVHEVLADIFDTTNEADYAALETALREAHDEVKAAIERTNFREDQAPIPERPANSPESGTRTPGTVKIDESGWGQQVAPELQGDKKAVQFGDKKPTGRNVGLSEFMDGFDDPQKDLFSKSSSSHADTGGYAERTGPVRETTQTFLELPEVVRIAKAINEGKLPKLVERLGNALGRFSHRSSGEADIKLRKDLFAGPKIAGESFKPAEARTIWEAWQKDVTDKNPGADIIFRQKFNRKSGNVDFKAYKRDPNYAVKILSHEIGHNVDFLPDSMVKGRGNILGHIAALKKYMKHTLEMYPEAKGKALTPEDRARLAKEARADVNAMGGADIVETVTREVPKYSDAGVTPEMITDIWNGMADSRNLNPDLYKFIAKMSDAEKKQVVVQAMKGVVDERLKRLGRVQTGTETITETRTTSSPVSPEAIRARTKQLIKEEIIKRRLYEKQVITDELKALTQIWKPFTPGKDAKYTAYRHSSAELYADATSVLFNEPQLLKDTAPTFYKAFFYYMGERPAFKDAYTALSRLSKDPQALGKERYAEEMDMYKRGNEKAEEIRKDVKPLETVYDTAVRWLIDKNHAVLKELPDTKAGREARFNLEEVQYIAGEVENYAKKAHEIGKEVEAAGVTVDDLSAYMLAKHIISSRNSIANAQGKTAATEQAKLDWMKSNFGADKFAALEKAAADYRAVREHVFKRMEESDIVTPELLEKVKSNTNYAHIDVQKYMDQKFGKGTAAGAGWKKMAEGTLEDVNNVFTATVLQDISIMRMAKINEAKRGITDVFSTSGLAKVAEMKWDANFKGKRPVEPGGDQAILTVLQKGKPVYYVVDKHVVDMFQHEPVIAGKIANVAGYVQTFFRDILVSKNPAWMARNIYRDMKGTVKNNPEIAWWNPADRLKLLKAYKTAFGEVKADVLHGKRSADIEMMHNEHMLNSDRMYASKEDNFDSPIERIAAEFRFEDQKPSNAALGKLKSVYEYLDKLGKISEQTGKVAGMKFLRDKGLSGNDLSHRVRTRIGTPDYKRQGGLQKLTNNLFMFSNVNKEGIRSAVEAFRHDPISYTFKTVESNLIPKLLLGAAAAGLMGEELKDTVNAIPSWVQRSYNVVPLPGAFTDWAIEKGIASAKDVGYIRLPSDYEGQFFGALAQDMVQGNFKESVSDVTQQIPYMPSKIHPAIKLAFDYVKYLGGESPRDDFRRKDVLTKEQQLYLDTQGPFNAKSAAGMGTHTWNMLGLGTVYQMDNKEFPKQKEAQEAAFKQTMRYLGGFVEFTDAGKQEHVVKGIIDKRKERSIKSFEASDAINEAVRSGKDSPSDIAVVYKQLRAEGKITPSTRYGAFRTRYMNTIMQRDYGIKPNSKAEQKTLRDFAR